MKKRLFLIQLKKYRGTKYNFALVKDNLISAILFVFKLLPLKRANVGFTTSTIKLITKQLLTITFYIKEK